MFIGAFSIPAFICLVGVGVGEDSPTTAKFTISDELFIPTEVFGFHSPPQLLLYQAHKLVGYAFHPSS